MAAIVQSAASSYVASNSASFTVTLSSSPTVGNTLLAFYGGLPGTINGASPPSGFSVIKNTTQANSVGINQLQVGIASRVVQSGDGTTYTFTGSGGSSGYGIGGVVYEISGANFIGFNVAQGNASSVGGGPVTIGSYSSNDLTFAVAAAFTAANASNGWTQPSPATSGLVQDYNLSSASLFGALGAWHISTALKSVTSNANDPPVNTDNYNWIDLVVNVSTTSQQDFPTPPPPQANNLPPIGPPPVAARIVGQTPTVPEIGLTRFSGPVSTTFVASASAFLAALPITKNVFGVNASVNTLTTLASGSSNPASLALDPQGNLWWPNAGGSTLQALPQSSGTLFGAAVTAGVVKTYTAAAYVAQMTFDADGNLFVGDQLSPGNVYALPARSGTLFGVSVTANTFVKIVGSASLVMNGSSGIVFDLSGNLWIFNQNGVWVLPKTTGTFFGQSFTANTLAKYTAVSGYTYPQGAARDVAGNIYWTNPNNTEFVATQVDLKIIPAVTGTVFGVSVTANTPATLVGGILGNVECLAFDAAGNLWLTNLPKNTIQVLPATNSTFFGVSCPANTITTVYSTGYPRTDGIAVNASGDVFVTQGGNPGTIGVIASGVTLTGAPPPIGPQANNLPPIGPPPVAAHIVGQVPAYDYTPQSAYAGTGTLAGTFAGTATATLAEPGTGTLAGTFAGTATPVLQLPATGTAAFGFAGTSSAGLATTGSAAFALSATATATLTQAATATGSASFIATATATLQFPATATGAYGFAGTASGTAVESETGALNGAFTAVSTPVLVEPSSGALFASFTATASGALAELATGVVGATFVATATASITFPATATASDTFTASSTAKVILPATGSFSGTFSGSSAAAYSDTGAASFAFVATSSAIYFIPTIAFVTITSAPAYSALISSANVYSVTITSAEATTTITSRPVYNATITSKAVTSAEITNL